MQAMENEEKKEDFQRVKFAEGEKPSTTLRATGNLEALDPMLLRITVELGRRDMRIKDVLSLGTGDVIGLDKMVGEPVDVFANYCYFATGEVVARDGCYGVRIVEIISEQERIDKGDLYKTNFGM